MGREIRRVPPNWEHPRKRNGEYESLYDGSLYQEMSKEWHESYLLWVKGIHHYQLTYRDNSHKFKYFFEYDMPPNKEEYTDVNPKECSWYQVYQTVSEGYPVTPPFATQEELINYLVEKGDFWMQKEFDLGEINKRGYDRKAAEQFVKEDGYAPSFVVSNGIIYENIECNLA